MYTKTLVNNVFVLYLRKKISINKKIFLINIFEDIYYLIIYIYFYAQFEKKILRKYSMQNNTFCIICVRFKLHFSISFFLTRTFIFASLFRF